jgi:hypothetical protein
MVAQEVPGGLPLSVCFAVADILAFKDAAVREVKDSLGIILTAHLEPLVPQVRRVVRVPLLRGYRKHLTEALPVTEAPQVMGALGVM